MSKIFEGLNETFVLTMFSSALDQDYLELLNFQTGPTWPKRCAHRVLDFWDHSRTIFGPCWGHVYPSTSFYQARTPKFS